MHRLIVTALLLLPLAGCLDPPEVLEPQTGARTLGFDAEGRSDPAPVPVGDCSAILAELNDRLLGQAQARLDNALERGLAYRPWHHDRAFAVAAGAAGDATAPPEVTGTNNQEAGADEADLVKTDGKWTYVLAHGVLRVLRSDQVGDAELVHSMHVGGGGQLLLERRDPADPADDRLIVLVQASDPRPDDAPAETDQAPGASAGVSIGAPAPSSSWYPYQMFTRVLVIGLENRTDPVILHERHIEGSVAGARLIDGVAHIVVTAREPGVILQQHLRVDDATLAVFGTDWTAYHGLNGSARRPILEAVHADATAQNQALVANMTLADHMPEVLLTAAHTAEAWGPATCGRVLSPEDGTGRSVNTVWSFDVAGGLGDRTVQVLGSDPIVYAAPGALVFAERSQDPWWHWSRPHVEEATNLHWFDLDGLQVTHRASGRIAGTVQDSFSLDVHDGHLRVITTTGQWGRWWVDDPEPMRNHLAVFAEVEGALVEQGAVSGFAPDERVWSARFTDERAYVVTFRQIDPLWIIDVREPLAPRILGELEIPGVSTYLHPIDDERLLAIGLGPRPDGEGLDWSRIQISLFDTSDPTRPDRLDLIELSPGGPGWSWSGATHEHKAFTYWDKLGMLAVPVSSTAYVQYQENGTHLTRYESHIALRLVQVQRDGLSLYGDADQDALDPPRWGGQIQRSHFLGYPDDWPERPVSVYAISDLGVTAHDLATLHLQASAPFPPLSSAQG